jgi:hypothetical protein
MFDKILCDKYKNTYMDYIFVGQRKIITNSTAIAARSSRGTGERKGKRACVIEILTPPSGSQSTRGRLAVLTSAVRLCARLDLLELPLEIDVAGGRFLLLSADADSTTRGERIRVSRFSPPPIVFFLFFIRVDV